MSHALPAIDMRGCARGEPEALDRARRAFATCGSRARFKAAYGWRDQFIDRVMAQPIALGAPVT